MKNAALLFALFVLLVAGAYYSKYLRKPAFEAQRSRTVRVRVVTPTPHSLEDRYSGLLPCADCSGIQTDISLWRDTTEADYGTFTEKEVYIDRNDDPVITNGQWSLLHGNSTDPDAIIFQLNPEESSESMYFLKVDDKNIKQLDVDKEEINSQMNYILEKSK